MVNPSFAGVRCNPGQVYFTCSQSSSNVGGLTCADLSLRSSGVTAVSTERCVDGCRCPEGQALFNDQCVQIDACPCLRVDTGRTYQVS